MIEVVLDFSEIPIDKNDTKEEKKTKFIGYVKRKLNLPWQEGWRGVWDAFRDDFIDIFTKVPPKDYVYQDNDEWCWDGNYDDYKYYVDTLGEIGPKDENSNKGDMKLIFINFYPFLKRNHDLAVYFLETILKYVNLSNSDNKSKCLADQWYKMIIEIKG